MMVAEKLGCFLFVVLGSRLVNAFTVCPRMYTEGLDGATSGYVVYSGVYAVQELIWNDFYVFKHEYLEIYIYYNRENKILWFGSEPGETLQFGAATTGLPQVEGTWESPDPGNADLQLYPFENFTQSWIYLDPRLGLGRLDASAIKLRCVSEDFQICSSGKLYFNETVNQKQSNGASITLNDPLNYYYERLHGVQKNARPVYKLNFNTFQGYLFYDAEYLEWVAGPDYNGNGAYFTVGESSLRPEYIQGTWSFYEEEEYKKVPGMALRCYHESVEGECSKQNQPCQNGGKCTQIDEGHVFCTCAPQFSGTTCEVTSPLCEPIGDDHGRSQTAGYISVSSSPGDIASFLCEQGYVPDFFLSTCVLSPDGTTSEWVDSGECAVQTTPAVDIQTEAEFVTTSQSVTDETSQSVTDEGFELTTAGKGTCLVMNFCVVCLSFAISFVLTCSQGLATATRD